ncbi:hypothetical protein PUN28_001896 [Cardiocondyla obscurior]|uniref:Uncharacterized protein n=1 Tax=Cardiocondyla obscurior TaxID=286306 RepID=A0AAW2GRX3_9HYME
MTCVGSAEIGGFCEKNNDCITPNSACDKKQQKCTCAKNHYESNRACLAGIDAKCTSDENCAPDNTICISDTCSCKSNYVPESINSCIPVSSFGESCLLDTQCSAVTLGAICASTENNTDIIESSTEKVFKMCTCAKEDYYKFGRCLKIKYLGEACTNLGECYECCNGNRMVCKSGKCACNWGYMPHKSNASVCVEHPESSKFFLRGK